MTDKERLLKLAFIIVMLGTACSRTPRDKPFDNIVNLNFINAWGTYGKSKGQFINPEAVTVAPNGNVYVADSWNHRVQYFTPTGTFLGQWGHEGNGNGQFCYPVDVAVGRNTNVYVLDYRNDRVQYFTANGTFLGKWGATGSKDGEFYNPDSIACAPNGNIYVYDAGNYRVQYFTPRGAFLGKWGTRGNGLGQFNPCNKYPDSIAISPNGNVYVTDYWNYRVQYFNLSGDYLGSWGRKGLGPGYFCGSCSIAITANGELNVVDEGSCSIEVFTPTGSFVREWGIAETIWGEQARRIYTITERIKPNDVGTGPNGKLYIAIEHRILYFAVN